MTTPKEQLPKGYRVLSPEWLETNPLPEDARYWAESVSSWDESAFQGRMLPVGIEKPYTYASATDLPAEAWADNTQAMQQIRAALAAQTERADKLAAEVEDAKAWRNEVLAELDAARDWVEQLKRGEPERQSHQESDGCPTEGAVLKREWRRLTAELDAARKERADAYQTANAYSGLMMNCADTLRSLGIDASVGPLDIRVIALAKRADTAQARCADLEKAIQSVNKSLRVSYDACHCSDQNGRPNRFHISEIREQIDALLSEQKPAQEQGWLPIESAPKDGTEILGYHHEWVDDEFCPDGIRSCVHDGTMWHSATWVDDEANILWHDNGTTPTHWQPLPAPPTPGAKQSEEGRSEPFRRWRGH